MKYLLRFLVFMLKNLVLILVVGALLVIAFTFAMDASNIYVIANDGMKMRTTVTLGLEEPVEMSKFFTRTAMENDALLRDTTYTDYTIRGIDYRSSVQWLWTWPWDSVAEVTLVEHVPVIDGELPVAKQNEEQRNTKGKIRPPAWQDARYELSFAKIDGKWKISQVKMLETVTPIPTSVPILTPSPVPTAQGTPVRTPGATPAP